MNRDRVTLASQRVADHHLADRLRDTTSWRSELASELDRNRQGQLWQCFKLSFKLFLSFPYEPLQAGLLLKIQIGKKVFFRNQTNLLLKTRAQLEHAMKETEHPLRVNSENIYTRWIQKYLHKVDLKKKKKYLKMVDFHQIIIITIYNHHQGGKNGN